MSLPPLHNVEVPSARRRRRSSSALRSISMPRRRKRLFIVLGSLLGVVVLVAAGVIVYARWRFDQIPKVDVAGLTPRVGNDPFTVLLVGSDSRAFVSTAAQA